MASVSHRGSFEEVCQTQSLPLPQSQRDCCSDEMRFKILALSVVAIVLLTLFSTAVSGCTIVGCINMKVGWGLIIGTSAVVSCVGAGVLKFIWKYMFQEGTNKEDLEERQKGGCGIGVALVTNITGVVIGVLSVSSIMSPMVGGILLATVVPILSLSALGIGLLY